MESGISIQTPLDKVSGISPRFLRHLEKLGLRNTRDLIFHFPTRYEDYSETYTIADLSPAQQATIQGVVRDIRMRRSFRRRLTIIEALITDETGTIRAVWFNQPYIRNILRPGRLANFAGKVSVNENEIYLSNPTYELISQKQIVQEENLRHTGRLVPIYPETRGLTSKGIRSFVEPVLQDLEELEEFLPESILETHGIPDINKALRDIHFPDSLDDALAAKKRFAFENLYLLQLTNLRQKLRLAELNASRITADAKRLEEMLERLPFTLTESQKKSLLEIVKDIEKRTPMNRLLQGDVGSGKTVIAALAALLAAENNFQAAFLAPTEILARQHYHTLIRLTEKIYGKNDPPSIGLLLGSEAKLYFGENLETKTKKVDAQERIRAGEIKIVIGTHAVIQKNVSFKNLALVVVDEQHRFGVEQRAALTRNRELVPHFLSMSATPIPRTLMMTVFGDLDVSLITELPAGRKEIMTKIVAPENRNKAYGFIKSQILRGRQVFVICPRIEKEEEKEHIPSMAQMYQLDIKSVKEEYEKLKKSIFPDLRIEMLHGKLKSAEKEKIMAAFKNKEIDLLVSTSVIEVGVDIPNATIMMIEGSERFGLAQLYQFRGRVGRGEHQSFCFLFSESESKTALERLNAIVAAKNGFELAEKDLELRGPGQFLGGSQSGLPDLAMRNLQDITLVKAARDAASETIDKNKYPKQKNALKKRLAEFEAQLHLE